MGCPLGSEWGEKVVFFSLARYALLQGLKLARVKPGDDVMLPEFICRELIASVSLTGARPLFYPIDKQLNPLAFPDEAGVKAILAVDYFGFPQDLAPFHHFCSKRGVVLIEDNAHGFLSRDESGRLLGTRGDLGILSLRKTFPLPDGGALITGNDSKAFLPYDELPFRKDPLSLSFRMKAYFRQIQRTTGIPLKNISESAVRALRKIRTGSAFPKSRFDSEITIPGPWEMHEESFRQLQNQNHADEVQRRRQMYLTLEKKLQGFDIKPIFSALPDGTAPYGYPFRAELDVAKAVASRVRKIGLDCPRWPDLPHAIANTAPEHYRNVYWVNFLC